ncbi:MAG: hypothetical protein WDW38_003129 [Sanguina aurantia]
MDGGACTAGLPLKGLYRFQSVYQETCRDKLKLLGGGEGELTIVTGVPNSGKSEFLDALAVNLAKQQGWATAFCSFEKSAKDHARALIEKWLEKPFFEGGYNDGHSRMTEEEMKAGYEDVNDYFPLINIEGEQESATIDWVLEKARAAVLRYGIRGLVIDPYNELDHKREAHINETEYVSAMLSKVKRFAQRYEVHVWFVAHPKQMKDWQGQAPTLYDISGSAHFANKADNGLVVHRLLVDEDGDPDDVEIILHKVRNKAAGSTGQYTLKYDRATGSYRDPLVGAACASKPGTQSRCMHAEAGSDKPPAGSESTAEDEAPETRRRLERRPHWTSEKTADEKMDILLERLEDLNISLEFDLVPGEWSRNTMCPQCEGGNKSEKSFVVRVAEDCESAFYRCYRVNKCNWKGSVHL